MTSILLVGSSKGLIIFSRKNQHWNIQAIQFEGLPVSMVFVDERTNTWWIAISHRHWGEKLHRSQDEGRTWHEMKVPGYQNQLYSAGKIASLKKIWVMRHAGNDLPAGLWMGTEPCGLFYSDNDGKEFHLVESLWNHPSRRDPKQWFGAGKDFPFIHSIVVDPTDSRHVYVAVSCAGVFETIDGGKNWQARNNGLVAAYLPDPKADVGHDPHQVLINRQDPKVLWQQNHCGIFRSADAGKNWVDVSGESGFPKYGFALAIDEDDPLTAWVIPAHSDEQRVPVGLKLVVCKTINGGRDWSISNNGLPDSNSFDLCLRHAFVKKDDTLVFGTNNGNLYLSEDKGERWKTLSTNLAMINHLAFA